MEDYFLMCKPAANLQATQFGWGGEQASGFFSRMNNDMIPFGATVATTCYGMNDGGYGPLDDGRRQTYQKNQTAIVQTLKKAGVRTIVVGSPGVVDQDTYKRNGGAEVYNKSLAEEGDIGKKVAESEGVLFADVHDPMMDVMTKAKAKYGPSYALAGGDGVHPDKNGHLVMAYAFLKALGCDGNIGTITVDLAGNSAKATDGHKIVSADGGKIQIESTRYPFCFFGDPKLTSSTAGVLEFLPFNKDLNRYMLVVTGTTAPKLKVTWGKTSKEFAAADLAKGINLADEFLDNPFCEPFMAAENKIREQQASEVELIKQALHGISVYAKVLPEKKDAFADVPSLIVAKDKTLREASAAAVAPVTHTIQIEAAQ